MDRIEAYLEQVCRGIGGPRGMRAHVRQELREHLRDAAARLVPAEERARLEKAQGQWEAANQALNEVQRAVWPTSSGVYWDVQDYLLEDLERIEVIRGTRATLWGANAVTGVINITSKSAKDTQGALITGTGGNSGRVVF